MGKVRSSRRKIWSTIADSQKEIIGLGIAQVESSIRARMDHLAVVCENFFKGIGGKIDGFDCHTIEFYYYMHMIDDDLSLCKARTDEGEDLVWLPIEKIEQSKIKPSFIREHIREIINEKRTIHVIEERDR